MSGRGSLVYRVIRGGCWFYDARFAQVASRYGDYDAPGNRYRHLGVRLARRVP